MPRTHECELFVSQLQPSLTPFPAPVSLVEPAAGLASSGAMGGPPNMGAAGDAAKKSSNRLRRSQNYLYPGPKSTRLLGQIQKMVVR